MGITEAQFKEMQERVERNKRKQLPSIQKASDLDILAAYSDLKSVWKVAERFDMCGQSVWERLKCLNAVKSDQFTPDQEKAILEFYARDFKKGELKKFCLVNRLLTSSVSRWAKAAGLTHRNRSCTKEVCQNQSETSKAWLQTHDHPKGMLGKKHSESSLVKISAASVAAAKNRSPEAVAARTLKMLKTKVANGTLLQPRHASWKQGWHEVGGKRCFFRSRWEVNYACYLHFLKQTGDILSWEYEPETFWFDGIKKGVTNYTPDFRVTFSNGNIEYHEVKGWMDAKSVTKLDRMRIYHPEVKMVIIDKTWFKEHKALAKTVPGWQRPKDPLYAKSK